MAVTFYPHPSTQTLVHYEKIFDGCWEVVRIERELFGRQFTVDAPVRRVLVTVDRFLHSGRGFFVVATGRRESSVINCHSGPIGPAANFFHNPLILLPVQVLSFFLSSARAAVEKKIREREKEG